MDVFTIVVGIAGTVGTLVGLWQYGESRRKKREMQERLTLQLQRTTVAGRSVLDTARIADRIVQRSKDFSATDDELRTLARLARGSLITLAMELDSQAEVLGAWSRGARFVDSDVPQRTGDLTGEPEHSDDEAAARPHRPEPEVAAAPSASG